jgi:hypothetical protein
MKLQIGQILYDKSLREYNVSKIGKVYFECEGKRGRYVIETLKKYEPVYTQNSYQLFTDRQEVETINELEKLSSEILFYFRNQYGTIKLPLENLRKIKELIK